MKVRRFAQSENLRSLDVKEDLRAGEYRRLKPYEIKQLNRLSMEGEQK